jgi:2-octaprenylphenol hydroxylase
MEMRADLLIVGAGMVGSALALALQDSGLEVLLLDGSPLSVKPFDAAARRSSRESAPCRRPASGFSSALACGTASPTPQQPVHDMHVWDGSGTGQIHFSAASVHAEVLGHIVENRVVQDALLDRLHDCDLGMLANARLEQMRRSGDDWLLTLADGRPCARRW